VVLGVIASVELVRLGILFFSSIRGELKIGDGLDADYSGPLPLVSVIVPARDEALHIEQAAKSVLSSCYPELELVLVNDRSSDDTPEIIRRIADGDPRVKVVTVSELPAGWTGKTHALHLGAEKASGDILVFTDADAVWSPDALKRSMRIFLARDPDVLSLLPGFLKRGFSENVVHPHLAFGLSYFYPLPRVNDPASPAALAAGCFIMMRNKTYLNLGTWKRFRGQVTEDVALSKAVKASGGRLLVMRGGTLVRTEPFKGVQGVCRFWKRTLYGALEKSVPRIAHLLANYLVLLAVTTLFIVSGATLLFLEGPGVVTVLAGVTGLAFAGMILPLVIFLRQEGGRWIWALAAPVGLALSAWIALSTIMGIVLDTGIEWRGSRYR